MSRRAGSWSVAPRRVLATPARIAAIGLFGIVAGSLAALAAIAFVDAIRWLNDALLISPRSRMMTDDGALLAAATVLVPTLGGLAVGLLYRLTTEGRARGLPDVIEHAQALQGALPVRSGLLSTLAAAVSLGCGASVGQYGPLAYLGATLGSWVARPAGLGHYLGTVGIGCGAAAAIATAFNAPIAGVVFAHEVILRHYSLRAFAPICVAAVIGYLFSNVIFSRPPLFRIDPVGIAHAEEFLAFIAIGIGGALLATLLMRSVLWSGGAAARLALPSYLKPALAGLLLGTTALWLPDVLGVGKEVLRFAIIEDAFGASELALILTVKLAMTALCLGFGFAGGVFSPALLIGILFGALVGSGAELLFGDARSAVAVYAVCGMVAVTSPVIGAPLTTILIVFELTRNYDLAIAAMVSVAFANLVGYRLFGRSLFDVQLARRGFDLSLGRDKVILASSTLENYLIQDFVALRPDDSLAAAKTKLTDAGQTEAYLLDADRRYLGTVRLSRILSVERGGGGLNAAAATQIEADRLVLSEDASIWEAMERMEDFIGERIPVVGGRGGATLRGVVYEAAIVKAYRDTLQTIRREENAAS